MADFPIQPLPSSILTERYSPSDTHRAILTERSFRSVSHDALRKALDIMTLGSVLQANRIIELLYQYNVPNFEDDDIQTAGFHFGWAHSQQWPQCLLDPDPNKPLVGRQDTEYGNQPEALRWMEERCRSHWDEQLRSKYPAFDTEDLNQAITMLNHQDRVSMSMSGRLWRLSQAMEIALMLEERWTAEDLLRKYIPDFMAVREHYDERGHEIAAGRQVWALLGGGFFAKALHVSEEAIARYVDSVLETLTQRFHNGPQRPCKGKSIKEMVDLLDKLWLEIKPLEPDNSELVNCGEAVPATFTHKGVSEDEIAEMEERLEIQLPTDLKEFLSSTNGFYHDKRMGNNNLFTDASHMVWEKGPYGVELLCWEELSIAFIYYFEWPKLYKGIQTGSGLDEGRQLLIKPRSVKEAIMEFDRKYEKADEGTKRVLERAATDFFGGLEQLREMEWMVIVSYHWNTGSVSYGSFQKFLEDLVLQAQERLEKVKQNAEKPERIEELREYKEGIERNRDSDDEGDESSDSDEGAGEDNKGNEPSNDKDTDKEEAIGKDKLESKDYEEDKAERAIWSRKIWAQASLPACAEICLESSTPAQGKCSNVDIGCLCSNVDYIDVLTCCLSKTCNAADQQVAQAFNQALCAGVNVIIPNFLGCGNASTTRSSAVAGPASTTVHQAGIELAVTVPTTGAVANFNGHALLTGTCSIAHPVLATVDNGGLMEYPRLGCSNEEPGCCPFDIHVGGPLSVCPEDYTTTSGACCPSGWSVYTSDLAGQTPCYTTTPLELATSTTLNINQRDVATLTPVTSGPVPTMLQKRQSLQAVHVISTHLFTLRYNLVPAKKASLSQGAKAGIAVGATIGGLLIIGLLTFFFSRMMRRRRERRAAAAAAAFAANSGIASPMTGYSTHPASTFHGQVGMNGHAGRFVPQGMHPSMSNQTTKPSSRNGASPPPLNATPMELPAAEPVAQPTAPPPEARAGFQGGAGPLEQHPFYSPTGGNLT